MQHGSSTLKMPEEVQPSLFSSLAALAVGVAGEFATDLVRAGLLFISINCKLNF